VLGRLTQTHELEEQVARDLARRGLALIRFAVMSSPVAFLLLAVAFRPSVGTGNVTRWVVVMTAAFVVNLLLVYSSRDKSVRRIRANCVMVALCCGFVWGATPMLLDPADPVLKLLAAAILIAVSAVAAVMMATERVSFWCMQIPISVLGSGYLWMSEEPQLRRIAPLAVLMVLFMGGVHDQIHKVIVDAVTSAAKSDLLRRELLEQQQLVTQSNDALLRANDGLERQAQSDGLTGLLNRVGLNNRLAAVLADHSKDGHVALAYLDLDRFKLVNDTMGHHVGDELLMLVAERIVDAAPEAWVARLGGDEFAILLAGVAEVDARRTAQQIRAALDRPLSLNGRRLSTNASIGLALTMPGRDSLDLAELHRRADIALYRAKADGRNRVALFDGVMQASIASLDASEGEIRDALDRGLIVPWFQPEIDLRTGEMIGAESLARWLVVPPGGGPQVKSAAAFMPLAAEVGLELRIADYLINASLAQRLEWHRAGVDPTFRLRMNITAAQASSKGHLRDLLRHMDDNEIPWSGISVELTETGLISDESMVRYVLNALRERGATVALDDFGTGYSSMSLLQTIPVDTVKIDRSFVRDICTDDRDLAMVRSMITLATDLGLTVTAEGVEHTEQAELLVSLGCHAAQGYLYSPAVPASELFAVQLVGRCS
jgi:diguanylate cyclase (GGDEF)-like protein